MTDWTDNVPALITELEDQIEDGIKVLGSVDTAAMSAADVAAMDCFTKAKDFLQQLVSAMGIDSPDDPSTQDNDSDANTGRSTSPANTPERRDGKTAPSVEALHLINGPKTLCNQPWIGHPEVRVRSEIGYVTCRECKRLAAAMVRSG